MFRSKVLLLLLCSVLLGCPRKLPQVVTDGGILVADRGLMKDTTFTSRADDSGWRIYDLEATSDGLFFPTARGAYWIDERGRVDRSVSFEPVVVQNPVTASTPASQKLPAFVGNVFESGVLAFYDWNGRRYAERAAPHKYMSHLFVSDVTGDAELELAALPAGAKEVYLYSADGEHVRTFRSPFYLTSLRLADVDQDSKQEIIVHAYPNASKGGTFSFVDGDGTLIRDWEFGPVADFDVVQQVEEMLIFVQWEGQYIALSPEGEQVLTLRAPHSEHFRDIHVSRWQGGWLVLASGSGYRRHHMISFFDAGQHLAYQEIGDGWASSLLVTKESDSRFCIAVENEVRCYSAAETVDEAPSSRSFR